MHKTSSDAVWIKMSLTTLEIIYPPGWIFTEHINKHVRGINIIIVRVTTDGASSPGVCRHRRWPSVANWQTRLVIVMNIIHKVNIMSAAPLPCRAREVA